jgi:tetratricopeptide (TPR) repeat protein
MGAFILKLQVFTLAFIFSFINIVNAHGDLHERIVRITASLEKDPENINLLLKRADLFRLHYEYDKALQDLDNAKKNSSSAQLFYQYAQVYCEIDSLDLAAFYIQKYDSKHPNSIDGRELNIKINSKRQKVHEVIKDYEFIIENDQNVKPSSYIALAKNLYQIKDYGKAIKTIDSGIERLGPLAAIIESGFNISIQEKDFNRALQYADQMISLLSRDEFWLMKKYEVLIKMNDLAGSYTVLKKIIRDIEALPTRHQTTENIIALKKKAHKYLSNQHQTHE